MENEKKNEKVVKEFFEDHPEVLDEVLKGIDEYIAIKKGDIPSFDEVCGDITKEYRTKNKKKRSIFLKKSFLIPVSICLVIGIFFVTPVGQACAESVYHTVIQWFDSGVNIYHGEESAQTEELDTEYYQTIADVRAVVSEQIAWNSNNSILDNIELEDKGTETQIVTNYSISSDSEITITQTIIEGNTEWDTDITSNGGEAIDVTLDDGTQFVGYSSGNYCYAVAYLDNTSIEVFSENSDYDSFVAFLEGIAID